MNVNMQLVILLHLCNFMTMKRHVEVSKSPVSHMFINLQKSTAQEIGYVIQ